MYWKHFFIASLIVFCHFCFNKSQGQTVDNVPQAFVSLSPEPKTIKLDNMLNVPTENGHLQGIQFIKKDNKEKLLLSGSSHTTAYVIQADISTQKTDKLIPLMADPFRHVGGIQATNQFIIAGIEDNYIRQDSKVCVYNYINDSFYRAHPVLIIERHGEPKQKTAGATGLLPFGSGHLAVVANWDSRSWDFYYLDINKNERKLLKTFTAPDDWAGYQAINLIEDHLAIYAICFYKKEMANYADLILISKQGGFDPIMEKVDTKKFNSAEGVDFGSAAGLQVDEEGKLHIWSSQKQALEQIAVSRFSCE